MIRDNRGAYWSATRLRAFVTLVVALLSIAAVFVMAGPLNAIVVLGFPLGVLVLANLLPLFLIAAVFWNSAQQDHLDRRAGMAEED